MSNDLAPDEQYEHLEWRPHHWRKQLSLKGRKMTVGQFVYAMRARGAGMWRGSTAIPSPLGRSAGSGRLL